MELEKEKKKKMMTSLRNNLFNNDKIMETSDNRKGFL